MMLLTRTPPRLSLKSHHTADLFAFRWISRPKRAGRLVGRFFGFFFRPVNKKPQIISDDFNTVQYNIYIYILCYYVHYRYLSTHRVSSRCRILVAPIIFISTRLIILYAVHFDFSPIAMWYALRVVQ